MTKAEGIPCSRDPGKLTSQSAPGAKAPCSYLYQNKTYSRAAGPENIPTIECARPMVRSTILGGIAIPDAKLYFKIVIDSI